MKKFNIQTQTKNSYILMTQTPGSNNTQLETLPMLLNTCYFVSIQFMQILNVTLKQFNNNN